MTLRILKPWAIVIATVIVAAIVVAACGSSAASGSQGGGSGTATSPAPAGTGTGGGATVSIASFTFSPAALTVKAGTKVTWVNNDSAPHNVTSTNGPGLNAATTSTFSGGSMSTGQTFSFTFTKPGTYNYECTIHKALASMHAKVIVK